MIMVTGIVAKNGILLLDAEQHFRELGFAAKDAMIQSGRRRLRPIVMTALATIAGMQPLAIAVVGGILRSMVLSLVFTPAINYYLQPKGSREPTDIPTPTPASASGLYLR